MGLQETLNHLIPSSNEPFKAQLSFIVKQLASEDADIESDDGTSKSNSAMAFRPVLDHVV